MLANINVSEPRPAQDPDSPLAFSMEGYDGQPPAGLISRYWSPGWNSVQALNKFQKEVGGPLRGGDPGVCLIKPSSGNSIPFFDTTPQTINIGNDERLLIAVYHLFGSEELSMVSPGIAQRAPKPYLALSPEDPMAAEGENVNFTVGGLPLSLPVRLMPGLPTILAGLPVGLPGLPNVSLPVVVKISRRSGA